jgi:hypothetical protein
MANDVHYDDEIVEIHEMEAEPGSEMVTDERGGWQCTLCHKAQKRVILLTELIKPLYACETCLFELVRDSYLSVRSLDQINGKKKTSGKVAATELSTDGTVSSGGAVFAFS